MFHKNLEHINRHYLINLGTYTDLCIKRFSQNLCSSRFQNRPKTKTNKQTDKHCWHHFIFYFSFEQIQHVYVKVNENNNISMVFNINFQQ